MPLNKAFHIGKAGGVFRLTEMRWRFGRRAYRRPPGVRLCAGEDTGRPRGEAAFLPGSGHGPDAAEMLNRQPPASIAGPPRHQGTSPGRPFPALLPGCAKSTPFVLSSHRVAAQRRIERAYRRTGAARQPVLRYGPSIRLRLLGPYSGRTGV